MLSTHYILVKNPVVLCKEFGHTGIVTFRSLLSHHQAAISKGCSLNYYHSQLLNGKHRFRHGSITSNVNSYVEYNFLRMCLSAERTASQSCLCDVRKLSSKEFWILFISNMPHRIGSDSALTDVFWSHYICILDVTSSYSQQNKLQSYEIEFWSIKNLCFH